MASRDQDQRKQRDRPEQPPRDAEPTPHRFVAGEYGEGAEHEATGVGPRNPKSASQTLNDQPANPDPYGNVAPGRYGVHGYSSSPGHPGAYAPEARGPRVAAPSDPLPDQRAEPADEQLQELIRQRLTEDPTLDAGDVTIEVRAGRVTLSGTVESARTRTEIEQTVENCGALEIENNLRTVC